MLNEPSPPVAVAERMVVPWMTCTTPRRTGRWVERAKSSAATPPGVYVSGTKS